MDNNSPEGRALSQTSVPSFPTDPDYVPCHKFDPRYPWDPIIPSDEEMEADAKMEQDMILAGKAHEKLARAQGKKGPSPLALKGESVRPVAPPGPGGLPMKLALVSDPGGNRSSSSGTRRFSASASGSRPVPEVRGRDRYTPPPAPIPGFSSISVPSIPARVPPLPSRPLGASAVASPMHIPPPMRHKLVDSTPAPEVKGKDGSTAGALYTRTLQPVAPAAISPIRRPSEDVGKPAYSPLASLTPQVLPSPTHSQAPSPTLSSSLPPRQANEHAYVSNANSLPKPTFGRESNPPISNAVADHQLAKQEEDENRKRELSHPGRCPPEWAGVAIEAERPPKGLPHPQAAVIDSPHKYQPPMVGDSHRRAEGPESSGGSPRSACDNSKVTRSRSKDGASGPILFADAHPQQHRLNSLLETHSPGDRSAQYCKELRVAASHDLSRTPSRPRQQQWDNRTQGQVQGRRAIPPRARSASPVTLPTTPRSWNPGSEPNSLRVVYPRHPYPVRDTQKASRNATPIRPTTSSDSQSTCAHGSTSGTQIRRGQWDSPVIPSAPTAAHHAQPPPKTVRSISSSPPYSPPLEMSATPSAKPATSDRHPRMPSETPSYEPPETFAKSDHSTPSYHPPSESYRHTPPSPPPQQWELDQNNRQPMQPPSRPDQRGPSPAGSTPALASGGVRVRGIASGISARVQAQAQTSIRAQASNYRGLEQRIGGGADNAVARLAVSRACSRRPRRASRFAIKGRAPPRPDTRRH